LDESIDSMTKEPLMFCHSESTVDVEADISLGYGGAISLGEEIQRQDDG